MTVRPWTRRDVSCLALLIGAVLLTYSSAFGCGFAYDDWQYVTSNPLVLAGLTVHGFRWAWTTSQAANWHPLTWLSLMLDTTLFGPTAWGYHLTNILLHLANTLLVFVLLRRMTNAVWKSAVVAALFAVHPLHVESVAWVSERKDVLSSFFGLLALLAYVRYAERPSVARYLPVAVGMALSLLAKQMWVTLPGMLLLLDYWPLRRLACFAGNDYHRAVRLRWALLEKMPLLLLAVGASLATLWAQAAGGALEGLATVPLGERLANAVVSYGQYLRQAVLPTGLACYYPYHAPGTNGFAVIAVGGALLGITGAVVYGGRKYPYLPVGWLWYLGTLVPVIGVVWVGSAARADRYTYIPLIGIFVLLVWGMAHLASSLGRMRHLAVIASAFIVCCMIAAWFQARTWENNVTVWSRDIAVTGGSAMANNNLAAALAQRGRITEAAQQCELALHFDPHYGPAHGNLGLLRLKQGRVDEAIREFQLVLQSDIPPLNAHAKLGKALVLRGRFAEALDQFLEQLRLRPADNGTRELYARTLLRCGRPEQAGAELDEALRRDPGAAPLWYDRAVAFLIAKDASSAESAFRRAVRLQPDQPLHHCGLATALHALGRQDDALAEYREASRLNPAWPQATLARAWTMATAAEPSKRDGPMAVLSAQEVYQALGDRDARVLDVLAAAYAEAGRFDEAITAAQRARALARGSRETDLSAEIAGRLELYRKGQAYHTHVP